MLELLMEARQRVCSKVVLWVGDERNTKAGAIRTASGGTDSETLEEHSPDATRTLLNRHSDSDRQSRSLSQTHFAIIRR